jgi:tetratricopeptide (TPR) repeat protein
MIFKRLLFAYLFLFFGICRLLAGNPGEFSIVENASYTFRYDSTVDPSLNNLFVKEIARLNFLNLHRTEYTLEYGLEIDIQLLPEMKLEITSLLQKKDLAGDIFYKDFNLSDVMTPSLYSFELIVSNGHHLTDTIQMHDLDVSNQNIFSTEISIGQPHGNLNIMVSSLKFAYTDLDLMAFEKRITAINNYLALSELSVFQLEKAGRIDAEDPDELLSAYFKIFDLERYLTLLKGDLQSIDFEIPYQRIQFLDLNLKQLNSNQRRLNTLFSQTLNSTVIVTDERHLTEAAQTITGMQLAYLDELTRQSFFYEPVYQNMASFFIADSSFRSVSGQLDNYFNFSSSMDNSNLTVGEEFNHILIEKYLLLSDSMIVSQKFHIAETLLESADAVCRATNNGKYTLVVYNKLSATKWGIYDAYIRVAQSAMKAGNLDMAKNYLETASGYQSENQTFITTNGFTLDEFERLAWAYFEQGNNETKSELFKEALKSFTFAQELYRMLGIMNYDEVISKRLANSKKNLPELNTN